jgi:Transposase and inactivated derivatives
MKDIDAVENSVAFDMSNGFVEGTNNKLKMVKHTMFVRCGKRLLSAKLMYSIFDLRLFALEPILAVLPSFLVGVVTLSY